MSSDVVKTVKAKLKAGKYVTKAEIRMLVESVEMYRESSDRLRKYGCGYVECGRAASGFSSDEAD